MTRSHQTAAAVEDHAADVYAGYVSDLRQELLEPTEFVLRDEVLRPRGSGRGRAIRDGVADWSEAVETSFLPDGGHAADHRERHPRD